MKNYFTITLLLITSVFIQAQTDLNSPRFAFEPDLNYNENIPSPKEFLGYELGTSLTLYAYVESYLKELAEKSDRVTIQHYGTTYEGRKLYSLVITSNDNQEKIDDLRATNIQLATPATLSSQELEDIKSSHPVTVSFSYNIHGNETSSTEAAMQVAYRLAAANDNETLNILDNAIILIFPCINADGRDRYVYWYKGSKRKVIGKEPRDMEHYAPFPNGRTNHYWFDLNRDWVWGVHPESRGHTKEYLKWMPQIHTDYHEMGYNSNYFTVPGTTPRNKLLPDNYEPMADTIGRANVAAFDKNQISYYTREAYDFFYPGYGSSYPSVMGAVGMLVEQGGIAGGRAIETNDGYILTLRQRIFDHYITSMATINKAVQRREMFIQYGIDAHDPKNSKSSVSAYILPDDGNPYLHDVINIMLHHGVKVHQFTGNGSINGKNYRGNKNGSFNIKSGDYIIHTNQSKYLFIHSIMSNTMEIEDSVMYDMSTWSAPLAYNLECIETSSRVNLSQKEIIQPINSQGEVINRGAKYAYSMNWNQRHAPRALSQLWEKGYRVRCATKSFADNERNYPAGTLIILAGRNLEKSDVIHQDMQDIANIAGVTIIGHESGRMKAGIDLSSRDSESLKKPKVAMLVDGPFSVYTSGQVYFLFDVETTLPIERVRTEILQQSAIPKFGSRYGYADLKDYDVLILPGGGRNLDKVFDKETLPQLKQWISEGGTVVALESAATFFTKNKKFNSVDISSPPQDTSLAAATVKYQDRTDYFGKKRTPGTALQSQIDISHPLAFGIKDQLYTLKFGSDAIVPNASLQSVGYYHKNANELLASGYIADEYKSHLAGKTFAAVQPLGSGKIVYLLDNPHYRMFWRGPSRMLQNAVMLLPGM